MTEAAECFSRFVRPYWRRLHLVARGYASCKEDAQDLVQETLMRAWENYCPFGEEGYREGWLFVILRRIAAEWARASRRRIALLPMDHDELTELESSDLTEPFEGLPVVTEHAFREFLDDRIAAGFDELEPLHREVILLVVAGDLNYREVAEVLDCPIGTVMSRMARARRALRQRLGQHARALGWKVETSK